MKKGVIVAKEGFHVKSELENLYVNTDTPLFKVFKSGSGSIVFNGTDAGPYDLEIPFDLPYSPVHFVYGDRAPNSIRKLVTNSDTAYPNVKALWQIFGVQTRKITVRIFTAVGSSTNPIPAGTYGYNYLIFYDPVSL